MANLLSRSPFPPESPKSLRSGFQRRAVGAAGLAFRKEEATALRRRLDAELVRRGLAASREQARLLVREQVVLVAGSPAYKPDRLVGSDEPIVLSAPPPRFVSRGGEKLESALDRFGIATAGRRCLDVGASTGGFTDCLLQRGACSVTALDVGHGQLHARLRVDPRVTVVERMNVRHVSPEVFGGCFDLVVGDLSFISLTKVAKQIVELASPGAPLVLLVKPQFEAGRQEANRARGVIKDPAIWLRTLKEVAEAFAGAGGVPRRAIVSPLRGGQGNVEFLLQLVRTGQPGADVADHLALDALAEAAVLDVTERGL